MKIKGAIFDMDGTVIDSLMFWGQMWQRIGDAYFGSSDFKVDEAVDKKVRTMVFSDASAYIRDYYGISADSEEFLHFMTGGLFDFYRDVAKPKAGAIALLRELKARNVKLCLASATAKDYVTYALECHGMLPYFDSVLSCADLGVGKDRPDIYLKARNLMGLRADEICVFEDSYVALETAKAAGFQTVGLYDQYNFEQERLEKASDLYLGEGHTLEELVGCFEDEK